MNQKNAFKKISLAVEEQVKELLTLIATNMHGKTIMVDYMGGEGAAWTGIRDFLQDENLMINMEWEESNMEFNSISITLGSVPSDRRDDWDITLYITEDHKYFDLIPVAIFKGMQLSAKLKESVEITL